MKKMKIFFLITGIFLFTVGIADLFIQKEYYLDVVFIFLGIGFMVEFFKEKLRSKFNPKLVNITQISLAVVLIIILVLLK